MAMAATAIFSLPVFASSTDGTIDTTLKYAWGENIGWINFGCDNCNVHITDTGITGYAWSENYGWINLNPSTSGVKNNSQGTLSGYGWGENLGWINFSGVTINSIGELTGYATINIDDSQISFNCSNDNSCGPSNFKVKSDWRPRNVRPACNNSTDDDDDGKIDYPDDPGCSSLNDTDEADISGGGLPPGAYNPPASPIEGFSVLINNGAEYTNSSLVTLGLRGGPNAQKMIISNFSDFQGAEQETYQAVKEWNLCQGQEDICEKLRINGLANYKFQVFAKFYTQYGHASEIVSDGIIYKVEVIPPEEKIPEEEPLPPVKKPVVKPIIPPVAKPIVEKPQIPLIEKIAEILRPIKDLPKLIETFLPEFLKPKPPEVPIEKLVPKQAPLTFRGQWPLLSYTWQSLPFVRFTLAPLPKEIRRLAERFPELSQTFADVGIEKLIDVEKLIPAKLTLPGLTKRVGMPTLKVEPGKFALPVGVPIAKLSPETKKEIPSEIVFAKTGGQLIDFNIALSISQKGEPQQKITTISGKSLQLAVKPDKPVKSVKGYVVFKSKRITNQESRIMNQNNISIIHNSKFIIQNLADSLFFTRPSLAKESDNGQSDLEISLRSLFDSLFFAIPSFAKEHNPAEIETKLVLMEFEYTDPDGDGIYTAEIQSPVVEGEYEIITVMDYDDPELGMKEIRLITVVDPEGYVYERDGNKETRIPGAIVSLYWLNSETKQYELWPAQEYQQENPQTTDVRGVYSFLAPEGFYYLKVEAPGYLAYDGKPFQVAEGSGIHINIELKTKYWWLKIVDLRTVILIIVVLLLLYNFYRDKTRERFLKPKT